MSPINFLDTLHDLIFVKGIIFKNVVPKKHWNYSTHQKCPKIRCLRFFVDTIKPKDTFTRYGKDNKFTYAEQPTIIGQGNAHKTQPLLCYSKATKTYILNHRETEPHILATTRIRGSVIVFICRLIHLKQFLQLAA
jgi:hypothetical protein